MSAVNRALVHLATTIGVPKFALQLWRSNPLILLYHGVSVGVVPGKLKNSEGKHISRDTFAKHLKVLKRYRKVIPLRQMIAGLEDDADMRNTISITFDDGYENNITCAAPLLCDFDMSATFFLTTGYIGTSRCIWTDQVEMLLDQTKLGSVSAPFLPAPLRLHSVEEKRVALGVIKAELKKLSASLAGAQLSDLMASHQIPEQESSGDYRFMSWDHVRMLVRQGFGIEGHTINHPILSRLPIEEAKAEILASRDRVTLETGIPSTIFCYPNGKKSDYTPELVDFCKQNFVAALSATRGFASRDEIFELRRLSPSIAQFGQALEFTLLREN